MYRILTGILCLIFLHPLYGKSYNFSTKELADQFVKKEEALGKRANLSVQKQEKQRYSVLLKGYHQWSMAFKQAQLLEKQGFSKLEVVKGRYERGYSIIVQQSLNKKNVGKTFNKLRGLGLKNVKVHTDKIKLINYSVIVHDIAPEKPVISTTPSTVVKKADNLPSTQTTTSPLVSDDIDLEDDTQVIVMSDVSDITYEIALEESKDSKNKDFEWVIDKAVLEAGFFTRSASTVDDVQYLHVSGHGKWQLSNQWEVQLAARLDGNYQHGNRISETDELDLDYGNSYILFREQAMRITLGTDTVRWGTVDTFAPTDNMATLDLTRGILYDWGEAYRSSPVIRGEFFLEQGKLDIVYLPYFREAELPDKNNVWHPVNLNEGALLGFGSTPLLKTLLQTGKVDDDINDTDGGFGIRYSTSINSIDLDVTLQQVKSSAPYYQTNPRLVANPALLGTQKYSLIEKHPRSWVVGGDMEFQVDNILLRFEAAWFSDLPATTKAFKYETFNGFKWAGGTEFYPGDGDTRVNLQLSGSHIDENEKIIDRDNIVTFNGEVESLFDNNRWKLSGRFALGLDEKDIYVSPKIAYLGWEPYELYSAIHYLDGEDNTIGGFYKKNSMITFGWRGQF